MRRSGWNFLSGWSVSPLWSRNMWSYALIEVAPHLLASWSRQSTMWLCRSPKNIRVHNAQDRESPPEQAFQLRKRCWDQFDLVTETTALSQQEVHLVDQKNTVRVVPRESDYF